VEFIKNEDYKYVRLLGAFYLRLVGRPHEVYQYLEVRSSTQPVKAAAAILTLLLVTCLAASVQRLPPRAHSLTRRPSSVDTRG
jgi:PRP38 family